MAWSFAQEARDLASETIAEAGVLVTILRPPSYPVVRAIIDTGWESIARGAAQLPREVQDLAGRHGAVMIYFPADTQVEVGEMVSWTDEAGREIAYTLHEARGLKSGEYEVLRPFVGLCDPTQG